MVHLKKERLPAGKHTKFLMKKIGPCEVLKKCGENAYKISLPDGIALSPIFNVSDLYPYKGSNPQITVDEHQTDQTLQDLIPSSPNQIECILDTRVTKQTRRHTYYDYLVKWLNKPQEDATWLSRADIEKAGFTFDSIPNSRDLSSV
ncbi:uncharacterized protein LOC131857479 [Cryptomeria japonica]|uniref:uncharacterized protein LOC131857479 n=1 Tax=Cryptomeria japonica TaxID=3369 RepID=UPI0027DA0003|nr:uncharacterized protein LOC131857479 [Cryptomeria japonica]